MCMLSLNSMSLKQTEQRNVIRNLDFYFQDARDIYFSRFFFPNCFYEKFAGDASWNNALSSFVDCMCSYMKKKVRWRANPSEWTLFMNSTVSRRT